MVKIIRKWGIRGNRDSLGNITDPKFTMGTDNKGNLYARHNEDCDTNMVLTNRDFKRKTLMFVCPKCHKTLKITNRKYGNK